jgi:hypothetical protein
VEYDFIAGIADSTTTLGADLFRYLGSEQKERRFSGWGGWLAKWGLEV